MSLFRQQLRHIFSIAELPDDLPNPKTSLSKEFTPSFYPNLYEHYASNIEEQKFIQYLQYNNDVTTVNDDGNANANDVANDNANDDSNDSNDDAIDDADDDDNDKDDGSS
jgi:hypothetical protein